MPRIETREGKTGTSYRVVYYVNGERNTYSDRDKSKVEAFAALYEKSGPDTARRILREAQDEGPTLEESMRTHIKQLVGVGPGTISRYERCIGWHFTELGQIRTQKLTQADVKEWIQDMLVKGLAPKTISNNHGFLAAALNTAVNHQVIPHNVTRGIRLPKDQGTGERAQFITQDEWQNISQHLTPHYLPFFTFLIGTGLRFGEATALTPKDIEVDGPVPLVRVTKAWKEDGTGRYVIGPPKTRRGRRTVSLAPSTLDIIRPLLGNEKLLFTNTKGDVITSSLAHKVWGPACLKAGYTLKTKPTIHALRHSHSSAMLSAGMDLFQLSRRLGHNSISITSDIYSDLLPDAHFQGAEVAARAFKALEA
ncbi:tyrosine-type recombinase/integrase [Arthrobacter sp. MDT1-65]